MISPRLLRSSVSRRFKIFPTSRNNISYASLLSATVRPFASRSFFSREFPNFRENSTKTSVEPSSIHSNSLFFRLSQFRSFAKTEDANPRSKVGTSVDTYYFERRDRGEFFDEGGVPGRAKFRSEESPCCFLRDAVTTVRTFPKLLFSRNY